MSTTIKQDTKTVEERLQPWLDNAEYLILLVIIIMSWAGGWVNLLNYESEVNAPFLGRYSLSFAAIMAVYTLGFGLWAWLIASPAALGQVKRFIATCQRQPLLFAVIWLVFGSVLWVILGGRIGPIDLAGWLNNFPLLEAALLIVIAIFTGLVLLAQASGAFQIWRKVVLAVLGLIIFAEIVLQGLAYAGISPIENLSGLTVPYGRVYQTAEGSGNGTTNRYGWYYPEFRLQEGDHRILLNGDSFIEALQISHADHMGVQLEALLGENTEVIAQGQLGYGATQFLNPLLSPYIWEPMQPAEMIVFFHPVNDFQVVYGDEPGKLPRVVLNNEGVPEIYEDDFRYWHTLAHIVIRGHDPADPWRTVVSNSMLLNWLADDIIYDELDLRLGYPDIPLNMEEVNTEQPFGPATFMFEVAQPDLAQQSLDIAAAQFRQFADFMAEKGIQVKVVTIPYFPQGFYDRGELTSIWQEYDVLLPERQLQNIIAAEGIPFLGMGEYMLSTGTSTQAIQSLFFNEGTGHLTPEGHEYFAQAVFDCFYNEDTAASVIGCDV